MKVINLDIPAAGTWKRDCELTDIQIKPSIFLKFNKESDDTVWKIGFNDFIAIKINSEEFTADECLRNLPAKGSFFEIRSSPWLESLLKHTQRDILKKCKHFVFQFYDETIEIIAQNFVLEQLKDKPTIQQ